MTYDDRDALLAMAGSDLSCVLSIQSLVQVPIEPGDDGPACHPQLIHTLARELTLLGLCSLSQFSPQSVDTTSTEGDHVHRSVEHPGS